MQTLHPRYQASQVVRDTLPAPNVTSIQTVLRSFSWLEEKSRRRSPSRHKNDNPSRQNLGGSTSARALVGSRVRVCHGQKRAPLLFYNLFVFYCFSSFFSIFLKRFHFFNFFDFSTFFFQFVLNVLLFLPFLVFCFFFQFSFVNFLFLEFCLKIFYFLIFLLFFKYFYLFLFFKIFCFLNFV